MKILLMLLTAVSFCAIADDDYSYKIKRQQYEQQQLYNQQQALQLLQSQQNRELYNQFRDQRIPPAVNYGIQPIQQIQPIFPLFRSR